MPVKGWSGGERLPQLGQLRLLGVGHAAQDIRLRREGPLRKPYALPRGSAHCRQMVGTQTV